METDENVEIGGYVLRFSVVYFLAVVAIATILTLLGIESGSSSVIPTVAGTMAVTMKFLNENKRLPNTSEKKQLIWYSLAVMMLISLVLVIVFLIVVGELGIFLELLEKAGFGLVFGALLFATAIELFVLYVGYGWLANKYYGSLVKEGKI